MMNIIERARELRKVIEQAAAGLDNKTAHGAAELYTDGGGAFWDGHLVRTGTRIRWNGALVLALNDLWASSENDPAHAPTLWEPLEYKDGYRVLTRPISASNPVHVDEICWENGTLYRNISGLTTTYRPSEYMAYWQEVASE